MHLIAVTGSKHTDKGEQIRQQQHKECRTGIQHRSDYWFRVARIKMVAAANATGLFTWFQLWHLLHQITVRTQGQLRRKIRGGLSGSIAGD